MSGPRRVLSIPPGAPFLPTLAKALFDGTLVPGFRFDGDPLALAGVTVYVPTLRAARALRGVFVDLMGGRSTILPVIRPLGEFDEDEALFEADAPQDSGALDLAPPIPTLERLLSLAPLARLWKSRLPAEVAARFQEEVVVPASAADAIWLARDLAQLMDEVETEGSDWTRLAGLVTGNLASWWQVTLDFLKIVTDNWPAFLQERDRSNPAAHRSALIRLEAARLKRNPPPGPVVAAGSTGSIPATAELLAAIAGLPLGAVVLPGFDLTMDDASFAAVSAADARPALLGHPQYGLVKLINRIGITRAEIEEIGENPLALRTALVGEALRPAETTELWGATRRRFSANDMAGALADVTLVEAANERDEASAVAIALRRAVEEPGKRAALVTGDRALARRVSAELLRFGIVADDSGGTPLSQTPPATLLRLALDAAFRPGDPIALLALLKHPLLAIGLERPAVRHAAETVELVALRGGVGRPDVASLSALFETRLTWLGTQNRPPFWLPRLSARAIEQARDLAGRLAESLSPLTALRSEADIELVALARASVLALENLGRAGDGSLGRLYAGDAGEKLAEFLRGLVSAGASFSFAASEWPAVLQALIASETVKPSRGTDKAIAIWGALEARLQSVDTLVIGALNEGVWPRKAESDRFMSRLMKTGIELEPPERRIGLAAHDFQMAMGAPKVVLTRAARSGDAPAVPSRWLQRLLTFVGKEHGEEMRRRGGQILSWARDLDAGDKRDFAPRPEPRPPVSVRPHHFSVTEIETLRRDPYAIYARRILGLMPLDPLIRDPGAAERGTLFHEILHRFSSTIADLRDPAAPATLIAIGRACFSEAALPADVEAVWWPRFEKLAAGIIDWERTRADAVIRRHAEERAEKTAVGQSGVTLSAYADRIDLLAGGMADILDYKTGYSPSKGQAHTLLAPQLALEGALLRRGAFRQLGAREPSQTCLRAAETQWRGDRGIDPRIQPQLAHRRRSFRGSLGTAGKAAHPLRQPGHRLPVAGAAVSRRRGRWRLRPSRPRARMVGRRRCARTRKRRGMKKVYPVPPETAASQARAADPRNSAWVSANAGAGKTHVLAQRVIRLLLRGTDPSKILCLTYTRAAAANMSNRVFSTLSEWTGLADGELAERIGALDGKAPDAALMRRARRLFAEALETPGGLKIQTIHAFCESVLHRFPLEANIAAHFEMLDPQMEATLFAAARRDMISGASGGNVELADAFATILEYGGEAGLDALLGEIVRKRDELRAFIAQTGGDGSGFQVLFEAFGFPAGLTGKDIALSIWPLPGFPPDYLGALAGACRRLGANRAQDYMVADAERAFAEPDPVHRLALLKKAFLSEKGEAYKPGWLFGKALLDVLPDLTDRYQSASDAIIATCDRLALYRMLEASRAALTAADWLISRYEQLKRGRGFLDFNDLITRTVNLLTRADAGPWVQYKLDQGIDHILLDEAQDTSPDQWAVVRRLAEEFFAGQGARDGTLRTIFAVGDEKQSIYSFQGAAPDSFHKSRVFFASG